MKTDKEDKEDKEDRRQDEPDESEVSGESPLHDAFLELLLIIRYRQLFIHQMNEE